MTGRPSSPFRSGLVLVAAAGLVLAGCNAGETAEDPTSAPASGAPATDEATGEATDGAPNAATDEATDGGAGGATDGSTGSDAGSEGVVLGFAAEPLNLDFTTTDGAAIPEALLANVYEGLVQVDQDGEIVPSLATDWTVSDDGRTYTFTLAEGVTFSNGDDFDSEDAMFSIERVQSDAWTISLKSQMDVVESVEAPSPTELVVTLAEPSNSWLFAMTTRIGAMFSSDGVDDLANTPVGTGPYEVADFVPGERIDFARRDDYWGDAPAYADVTFRYFSDGNALNSALLSGGIDVIATVQAPEAISQFEGGDYEIIEGSSNGEVVLSMNNASPPLDDVRVRRAIRYAIDNEAVRATAWAGYGELIGTMGAPTDPWFAAERAEDYPTDPEQAVALLDEAGVDDLTLDFRVPNLPYAVNAATTVQSNLAQVGITADITPVEFPAVWLEEVFTDTAYDLSIIAHVEPRDMGIFADPEYYFQYDSQEYRDLLAQADTGPAEDQAATLAEAGALLSSDAAAEFLFLAPTLIVTDGTVTGLPVDEVSEAFDVTALRPA